MHLTISEAVLQTIILPMDELPQFFELLYVVTGQKLSPRQLGAWEKVASEPLPWPSLALGTLASPPPQDS